MYHNSQIRKAISVNSGIAFFCALITLVFISSFTFSVSAGDVRFGRLNNPPEPRLLYPINDKVIITGNEPLEFRWLNDYAQVDHFIFKIYKGYNMYADGLIYKQNIPSGENSVKIKSDLFEPGHVYTWSLIQVVLASRIWLLKLLIEMY